MKCFGFSNLRNMFLKPNLPNLKTIKGTVIFANLDTVGHKNLIRMATSIKAKINLILFFLNKKSNNISYSNCLNLIIT